MLIEAAQPRRSGVQSRVAVLAVLVLIGLAIVPYLPFFTLPHISDDYLQMALGRRYGPVEHWDELAADALYRCRATSILITNWTERWVGVTSPTFQAESVVLHVLNTLLIAAFGWWGPIGWRLAIIAAGFFAVHEGHQEAVVWYAALPELLVFFFAMLSMHAWLAWVERGRMAGWGYAAALVAFVLALLSKESAVAVVPLMLAAATYSGRRNFRTLAAALAPFVLLSLGYAASIFAAKDTHLHLNDGTFSVGSQVAEVVARSTTRLLWIWGVAALAYLAFRRPFNRFLVAASFLWIVVTLLPYSFLKYMPHVPSRHVYWASVGLAFLVAGALVKMLDRHGHATRRAAYALCALIVIHNCGYLWLRKFPQYERRVAPTEKLVQYAETYAGPITVKCFPYGVEIAVLTLHYRLGRSITSTKWNPQAADGPGVYCDNDHP